MGNSSPALRSDRMGPAGPGPGDQAFRRMAEAIAAALDIDALCAAVTDALRPLVPFERISLARVDLDRRLFEVFYQEGVSLGVEQGSLQPLADTAIEVALRAGQPVASSVTEPGSGLRKRGGRSRLHVPLFAGGETLGTLNLGTRRADAYPVDVVARLRPLQGMIAVAFRNAIAHREARRGEQRFRRTFDAAGEGIVELDAGGQVLWANPAGRALLALGGVAAALAEAAHADPVEPRGATPREITAHDPTQGARYLALRLTHVPDAGDAVRAVGVLTDVSERRRLEADLFQAAKLASLGELAAGIAHEIRNPLSGIRLALACAEEDLRGRPDAEEAVRRTLEDVDRLDRVVRQLLDLARPGYSSPGPTPLSDAVDRARFLVQREARGRGVRLEVELPAGLPPVRASADGLVQILLNLLQNAIAYTPPNGRVRLAVAETPERREVELRVIDDGPGIDPGQRTEIFRPFFTTRPGGTGLGLSVVRRLLVGFGGRISVDAAPGGTGAAFTVGLKRA